MEALDLKSNLAGVPELLITAATTESDAAAAIRVLAAFNQCMVGLVRFSGETPWERHPGDELLYVIDGAVDVTVLPETGDGVETRVAKGSIFVVPKDRWHRQRPQPAASLLFITPAEGTGASWADDPRRAS